MLLVLTSYGCGVSDDSSESKLNSVENLIVDGIFSPRFIFDQRHIEDYEWTLVNQTEGNPTFDKFGFGTVLPPGPPVAKIKAPFGRTNGSLVNQNSNITIFPTNNEPTFRVQHSASTGIDGGKQSIVAQGEKMKVTGISGKPFLFDYHQNVLDSEALQKLREAGITRVNISAALTANHTVKTKNDPLANYLRITCSIQSFGRAESIVLAEKSRSDNNTDLKLSTGVANFDINNCKPGFGASSIFITFRIKSSEAILSDFVPILSVIR